MNSQFVQGPIGRRKDTFVHTYSAQKTKELYSRAYVLIKSQRTVLNTLLQQMQTAISSADKNDKMVLEYLHKTLTKILSSDYNTMISSSSNALLAVQSITRKGFNSADVRKYTTTIFNSLMSFIQLSHLLIDSAAPSEAANSLAHSTNSQPIFSGMMEGNMTVCRLCNESIPTNLFEQHMKSCSMAYLTQEKIEKLEVEIRNLIASIGSHVLNCEWPNDQEKAVEFIFPMVALKLTLEQAISIDPNNQDSYFSLLQISRNVNSIPCRNRHQQFMANARYLIKELIKRSLSLNEASNVLQNTRVSGSGVAGPIEKVTIGSFFFIKRISAGAYARVFLAKNKKSGDIYAIKVTKRSSLIQKNEVQRVIDEKDILLKYKNPHIVNFYYSFVGQNNLYLVMEFLPGGDLYSLLQSVGCFDEIIAKTYAFQVLEALKYLHQNRIIHRDLKPDNLLVAQDGVIKLTDFGLSFVGLLNRQSDETASIIGTPDYTAPEIVLNHQHSYAVDYWSLGIIIYEFLLGAPPFHADTEMDTFRNILTGNIDFSDTDDLSRESLDLISRLLVQDPKKRLGANGIQEIYDHPWFKGFDLSKADPPFIPDLKSKEDVGYFEQRYEFSPEDDADIQDDIEITDNEGSEDQFKEFGSVSVSRLIEQNEEIARGINVAQKGDTKDTTAELPNQKKCEKPKINSQLSNTPYESQKFSIPFINGTKTMNMGKGSMRRIKAIIKRSDRKPLPGCQ